MEHLLYTRVWQVSLLRQARQGFGGRMQRRQPLGSWDSTHKDTETEQDI